MRRFRRRLDIGRDRKPIGDIRIQIRSETITLQFRFRRNTGLVQEKSGNKIAVFLIPS